MSFDKAKIKVVSVVDSTMEKGGAASGNMNIDE